MLSIMTVSIKTINITMSSIRTLSITVKNVKNLRVSRIMLTVVKSSALMLSVLAPVAYKPIMIIDDDSSVINKLETSVIDNASVIIYDRHMLIVQATSKTFKDQNITNESGYHEPT